MEVIWEMGNYHGTGSRGEGRRHKGDHALAGKRLTEILLNLGQKQMPAGLRTAGLGAVPQGALLQEQTAPASLLSTKRHRKIRRGKEIRLG